MDSLEYIELGVTIIILLILVFIFLIFKMKNTETHEENKKIPIENRYIENNTKCKIPRRIVQTYFCREVPERMYNAINTFKELNPNFAYIFYDDEDARFFLETNYKGEDKVVEAFDMLIPGAYKADLFRLCELYIHGGYYADIFMVDLEPLEILEKYNVDCILVKDCEKIPNGIYNAFMACSPKDKFIRYLIDETVKNILNRNMGGHPLDITGPIFIGKMFNKYMNVSYIQTGLLKHENKNILILKHNYNDSNCTISINETTLIKTKYSNFKKDRINSLHYTELYKLGKVFKDENMLKEENERKKSKNLERKKWWNEKGKYIKNPEERLNSLHNYISLNFGNIKDEYPEQLMSIKYITPDDTVLEIGGNIGRNTCIIASILDDDRRLVTLESSLEISKQLLFNKNKNNFDFHVESSALSKVPLIQKGWDTIVSKTILSGYTKVNTITFKEIEKKYNLKFNVLVVDCEGALYQILKDEPNLLTNIKTIIIENDFKNITEKQFVDKIFSENNFRVVYSQKGGWGPCEPFFYQVFQK